jgi:hypothetical protein
MVEVCSGRRFVTSYLPGQCSRVEVVHPSQQWRVHSTTLVCLLWHKRSLRVGQPPPLPTRVWGSKPSPIETGLPVLGDGRVVTKRAISVTHSRDQIVHRCFPVPPPIFLAQISSRCLRRNCKIGAVPGHGSEPMPTVHRNRRLPVKSPTWLTSSLAFSRRASQNGNKTAATAGSPRSYRARSLATPHPKTRRWMGPCRPTTVRVPARTTSRSSATCLTAAG